MFKHKSNIDRDVKTPIDDKYIRGSWDSDYFRKIVFGGDIGDVHYAPVSRHKKAERKKREEDEKKMFEKIKKTRDTGKPKPKYDRDAMHYS